MRLRWTIGVALCAAVVFLGVYRAWAATTTGSVGQADTLYRSWRAQMGLVAYAAKPSLPSTPSVRFRQVFAMGGQNQRAAGMAAIMQAVWKDSVVHQLADSLESINTNIDQMLQRMETGYSGRAGSRASAGDIAFIRRVVTVQILQRLPPAATSHDAVSRLLPELRRVARLTLSELNTRFVAP